MQITFGMLLDGEHAWRPANRLGQPILGPLGMLNLLETRLGLLRAECAHAQRVSARANEFHAQDQRGLVYTAFVHDLRFGTFRDGADQYGLNWLPTSDGKEGQVAMHHLNVKSQEIYRQLGLAQVAFHGSDYKRPRTQLMKVNGHNFIELGKCARCDISIECYERDKKPCTGRQPKSFRPDRLPRS